MTEPRREIARITLSVLTIGVLILGSLWILRPFLGAVIWATMVVVATWPVLLWLQDKLWGRRCAPKLVGEDLRQKRWLLCPGVALTKASIQEAMRVTGGCQSRRLIALPKMVLRVGEIPPRLV